MDFHGKEIATSLLILIVLMFLLILLLWKTGIILTRMLMHLYLLERKILTIQLLFLRIQIQQATQLLPELNMRKKRTALKNMQKMLALFIKNLSIGNTRALIILIKVLVK